MPCLVLIAAWTISKTCSGIMTLQYVFQLHAYLGSDCSNFSSVHMNVRIASCMMGKDSASEAVSSLTS